LHGANTCLSQLGMNLMPRNDGPGDMLLQVFGDERELQRSALGRWRGGNTASESVVR